MREVLDVRRTSRNYQNMQTTGRGERRSPLDHDPEALAWARKKVGYTQAALAREVGISPGHMSEIEKGTRNAPPHLINALARALNCPTSVLERKRVSA